MEVHYGDYVLRFPFASPYSSQIELAKLALDAMSSSNHAVLESPTGTGKTMAMLAATFAYVQGPIDELCHQKRVVYASRTHGQLAQVATQFRKWRDTFAPNINVHNVENTDGNSNDLFNMNGSSDLVPRAATIGSRDQLCVHEKLVGKASMEKNALCRVMVKNHTCSYKLNLDKYEEHSRSSDLTDIEDLMRSGRSHRVCPYYLSRDNASTAHVLFVPYNYLLERSVRETLNFDLEQSVVIVDEAHNVNALCEDAASVDFSMKDLALAIKEIDIAIAQIQRKQKDDEENTQAFEATRADGENDVELGLEDACSLKQLLLNLERNIETYFYTDEGNETSHISSLASVLSSSGFVTMNVPRVLHLLLKAQDMMAILHSQGRRESGQGVSSVTKMLRLIFESDENELERFYRIHNHKEEKRLSLWCFHSLVALRSLLRAAKVRSIIFTSGTLKPMETFSYELGLELKITRSFGHIIDPSRQLLALCLSTGPDSKTPLLATYENRSNALYLRSLGGSLVTLLPKIRYGGSLVFFPSHSFMSNCIEFWKKGSNVWQEFINNRVEVIVEPRKKDEFNVALKNYCDNVKAALKPICLMAVCRGRAAEGIDFSDAMARAVFVVGLPFPNLKEPRVQMKKNFLDTQLNDKRLTGSEWYSLEAYRAVNQGVGRILRHKNDFGAVIFLDKRFGKGQKARFGLAEWIQGAIRDVDLSQAKLDVETFFANQTKPNSRFLNNKASNVVGIKKKPQTSTVRSFEFGKRKKIVVKNDDRQMRYKVDELVEALRKNVSTFQTLEACSDALKSFRVTSDMDELKESLGALKEQFECSEQFDDLVAFIDTHCDS